MSCLHTISKSPAQGLLEQCLRVARPGDGILFIEDGVYHCLESGSSLGVPEEINLFSLKEDMQARGLLQRNRAQLEIANYQRFVELACKFEKSIAWF